jgi:hypothetical protein
MGTKFIWYLYRLRAMGLREVLLHLRKRWRQATDARRVFPRADSCWQEVRAVPRLPDRVAVPEWLQAETRRQVADVLAGHWHLFGHLSVKVDDPPRWQCDYHAGRELATSASAFRIDHRRLGGGADVMMIWELNRWSELVRLAQGAFLLGDTRAARKCLDWLEDWLRANPPYRGWNWTSGLEAAVRLIQFAWIDALLTGADLQNAEGQSCLARVRSGLLPAHAWLAWRHRSFGSSANNHLLGELAGLVVAGARWPALARWSAPLGVLQRALEREILAQFAGDGGNREQALSYHLFSFELAWQARLALAGMGRELAGPVEERLARAARFYVEVQPVREPWDYGDSAEARVTPLFGRSTRAACEWNDWLARRGGPGALDFWLGAPPRLEPPVRRGSPRHTRALRDWWWYPESGIATAESGFWFLRWDLSPLGFLSTAAHGHLDALHLSIWWKGVALVVDPGTGTYYHDPELRRWLSSRAAHNAPCPADLDWPRRQGPFLWSNHHPTPEVVPAGEGGVRGSLELPGARISRRVLRLETHDGWLVEDAVVSRPRQRAFSVIWQFAPDTLVRHVDRRKFRVSRADVTIEVEVDPAWLVADVMMPGDGEDANEGRGWAGPGTVSRRFRELERAPCLRLEAVARDKPCLFQTSFLALPAR